MTPSVSSLRSAGGGRSVAVSGVQALARFEQAIDAHTMGPRLAAALGTATTSCHVLDAKFQPGAGATVLYELDGLLVRGDLLLPLAAPPPAAPVVGPGLALHPFPHDPDLTSLTSVMDPARIGQAMAVALGSPASAAACLAGPRWRTDLIRYRPGRRATVLLRHRAEHRSYVAKVYHDPAKAAAVTNEAQALASAARSATVLRFAPVVAHLDDLVTVVQATVGGTPLSALLGSPHGPARGASLAVRCAARAVAELHDGCPTTARTRPVERELHRFLRRATAIREVARPAGHALVQLAERLSGHAAQLPAPELGTVHGDCKPSQFLLDRRAVYLLDVDHLGVSDVTADVGTFIASLRQLGVHGSRNAGMRTDPYGELADVFLREYVEARASTPDVERIRWQEAVALERKALRAFARAPRSPVVTGLVAEAHRCLDRAGVSRAHG